MANNATLQRTIFQNVGSDEKTFGYRIYDDYGQDYCNTMDEADMSLPPLVFFAKVRDTVAVGETFEQIISNLEENEKGITIDGQYFDNSEIF